MIHTKESEIMNTIMHKILCVLLANLLAFPAFSLERVRYIHADAVGSPSAATDENGEVVWREYYRPFGSRVIDVDDENRLWFTGKLEEPDIGLSYFGARWYDPDVGRFAGVDPAGIESINIHSFNRYAYALNNPYLYLDPNGRWAVAATQFNNPQTGRSELSYYIRFDRGGSFAAAGYYVGGRISKLIKSALMADDAIRIASDSAPGYVGHMDIGGIDELTARAADGDIQKTFREKFPWFNGREIPKEYIEQALKALWESTPPEIRKLYKYKSHKDILEDANKHYIPHVTDLKRKDSVGNEF